MIGKTNAKNQSDQTIPVGTGAHLVTFYDFDGKVLKRERVATGGNATAPVVPIHQYLTFAEWNNPFTNVQSDIDTGAIYNTTDGKTYLFITLTAVTGLSPTLYFSKSSTSLMTISWGDGATSTSTTSGNQTANHTYAAAGSYIITVDNSAGGTWTIGQGATTTKLFHGYDTIITKIYLGNYVIAGNYCIYSSTFEHISTGQYATFGGVLTGSSKITHLNIGYNTLSTSMLSGTHFLNKVVFKNGITTIPSSLCQYNYYNLIKKVFIPTTVTTIAANSFANQNILEYIITSNTPPTLANVNAFTGINPITKIYVPDASVDAYKAATNWVTYANYIYPLSQKPQSDE